MIDGDGKGRRLNWRQACEIMGCSQTYFYRLINEGLLPATRVKGKKRGLLVYEADCLALVEPVPTDCDSPDSDTGWHEDRDY